MADLNEVRLIGRLTRDPVLRSTPAGQYVCDFGLATGKKFKGQDGVVHEETTFVDITCWGKTAENVSRYTKKGRQIFIGGRLKFEQWDDKTTGQKRSRLSVVAENVQFLEYGEKQEPIQQQQPQQAQQKQAASQAPPQQDNLPMWTAPGEPDMGEPPF